MCYFCAIMERAFGEGIGQMAYVFGITGGFGNGKSTTAVIKAHQWAAASGAKIFANFPMRGAYIFDHYTDWYRIADVHGSIVVFDESQSNFDGRQWGGEGNIALTQLFNFVRKLNTVFIFVLPSYENIDTRIRQKTDILINCVKTQSGTIINTVYDYTAKDYGEWGRLLNRWILPPASQKKVYGLNLFDTNSMVHRFPMPAGKKNIEDFFKELERRHTRALERYGLRMDIQTLVKEDLDAFAS